MVQTAFVCVGDEDHSKIHIPLKSPMLLFPSILGAKWAGKQRSPKGLFLWEERPADFPLSIRDLEGCSERGFSDLR
nr:hypothetical protein [uncultured Porphyromonas sp.]